jgi:hypothetical protein
MQKAKAHQLTSLAGRGKVSGYENPRFYFVLNRHASALCSPEPQRGGLFDFGGLALPQLGQTLLVLGSPKLIYLACVAGTGNGSRDGMKDTSSMWNTRL